MRPKEKAALISLINSAGAALEAAYDLITKDDPEGACEHPEDKRKDYSTMGVKRWLCQVCGYLYEQGKEDGE